MNNYKASPVSRLEIRNLVNLLKKEVGLENELFFPVVPFAENVLPLLISGFEFHVLPKEDMGNVHGETYPNKNIIRIREDVYLGAVANRGRDRFTIAHEIGHLFMHERDSIVLYKLAPHEKLPAFVDPEWQANAFGGELLIPAHLINGMSEMDISIKCGVSLQAAQIQTRTLHTSRIQ